MKLFDGFEAVKFSEENLILVTHNGFLYYIYNPEYKYWRVHRNAGNDHITTCNYEEVSRAELEDAMHGVFPQRDTDFTRLCNPSQLNIGEILSLLEADYANYMSDHAVNRIVHRFLLESAIPQKTFEEVKKLLDNAAARQQSCRQVIEEIKELSFAVIGRNIFKKEIRIVDGHNSSSYFWIMPVRVVDYSDTNSLDNVAEMRSVEISIEENDVDQYLTPFLYKYFDNELEANKKRVDADGFEWYLTHNFYTLRSMTDILKDIKDTVDALSSGRENEFTIKLREKRGTETYQLVYAKGMSEEQIEAYNANRPIEDDTEAELIIDFYRRFLYRIEYMMTVGKEKGYDLISFMGP